MRYLSWLLCLLFACSSPSPPASEDFSPEAKEVLGNLETFFAAASVYDYVIMEELCLRDFHFSESGESWTLDQLITFMDYDRETVRIEYKIVPDDVNVKRTLAWVHFHNHASVFEGGVESKITWQQTAALKKTSEGWLLIRIEGERISL